MREKTFGWGFILVGLFLLTFSLSSYGADVPTLFSKGTSLYPQDLRINKESFSAGSKQIPPEAILLWSQEPNPSGIGHSSQLSIGGSLDFESQLADDFLFNNPPAAPIQFIEWWGNYWNGPGNTISRFNFYIYEEDGTTCKPTMPGNHIWDANVAFANCHETIDGSFYRYWAEVPPFIPAVGTRYFLVIQAELPFPPQWGLINAASQQLCDSSLGFPYLSIPYWTFSEIAFGTPMDYSFKLYGIPTSPTPTPTPTIAPPDNDQCPGIALTIPTVIYGSTTNAVDNYHSSCAIGSYSPDVVYNFTVTERIGITIFLMGNYDTSLYVQSQCGNQLTEIACNDDYQIIGQSLIDFVADPGTYYIIVDGYGGSSSGDFSLDISSYTPLNVLRSFQSPFGNGYDNGGLAHDGQYLYVMDQQDGVAGRVFKLTEDGNIVAVFPSGLDEAWGLAYQGVPNKSNGYLWLSDLPTKKLYQMNMSGNLTGANIDLSPYTSGWIADLAFDGSDLWVVLVGTTGIGDIAKFDLSGNYIRSFTSPGGTSQRGIAYDPMDNTLWFGGWNTDKLYHADLNGNILGQWGQPPIDKGLAGLAINPNTHHLWMCTNSNPDMIYELDINIATPTPTPTPIPTDTPTLIPTDTPTPLPTDTPTSIPTDTLVPTDTPIPTDTPTPLPTDTPTEIPTDTPTEIPNQPPVIAVAGYLNTYLEANSTSNLFIWAYVTDPDGDAINKVNLFYEGADTGLSLNDDGSGVFSFFAPVAAGPELAGVKVLLELKAFDSRGGESLLWPYLDVPAASSYESSNSLYDKELLWSNHFMLQLIDRLNSVPKGSDGPFIAVGGYWDTNVTSAGGGDIVLLCYVMDNLGVGVNRVHLFFSGVDTKVQLLDDGTQRDFGPGDKVYGIYIPGIAPGSLPAFRYLIELKAWDNAGNESDLWPWVIFH